MTKQIVIKLNKKKFDPLLKFLLAKGGGISTSYSECAGKALFFAYLYFTEKISELNNKTRLEHFNDIMKSSHDSSVLSFLSKYKTFLVSCTGRKKE